MKGDSSVTLQPAAKEFKNFSLQVGLEPRAFFKRLKKWRAIRDNFKIYCENLVQELFKQTGGILAFDAIPNGV